MLTLLASVFASYIGLSTATQKYSHVSTPAASVKSTLIGIVQCLCGHKPSEEHL